MDASPINILSFLYCNTINIYISSYNNVLITVTTTTTQCSIVVVCSVMSLLYNEVAEVDVVTAIL